MKEHFKFFLNLFWSSIWSAPLYNAERLQVFVINKNYFSTLAPLVKAFKNAGIKYSNIYIIDMGSTSPATIREYTYLRSNGVRIITPSSLRFGPYTIWKHFTFMAVKQWPYPFLVTDSDICLPDSLPNDWLERLYDVLVRTPHILKTSLELDLNNIDCPRKNEVVLHESNLKAGLIRALLSLEAIGRFQGTDTTISLYKPFPYFSHLSIRLNKPYCALHLPWYTSFLSSNEYKFYSEKRDPHIGDWH